MSFFRLPSGHWTTGGDASFEEAVKITKADTVHKFGNTQIHIPKDSSAAALLTAARKMIDPKDVGGDGFQDDNHVTVRYGLENDDVDALRDFIALQTPFEATTGELEFFTPSEHSDEMVPVVVQIISADLRAIEKEIGKHGNFKEKNFPTYKPHCTLAYVKPDKANKYKNLYVKGANFLVRSITISHKTGVMETIPFGVVRKFNPYHDEEGKFTSKDKDADGVEEAPVVFYHGTPEKFLESIRTHGLMSWDEQEDRKAGTFSDRTSTNVHMTPSLHMAEYFGKLMADNSRGGEAVIIEVRVPQSAMDKMLIKHHAPLEAKYPYWGTKIHARYPTAIPPEWLGNVRRLVDGKWVVQKSDEGVFYAVVVVKSLVKKADKSGRYVTPFVSFDHQGNDKLQLIASLNSSRMSTWGFTAEAEVRGITEYQLTNVLDGRTSKFCRLISGKRFKAVDARAKVTEVLNAQSPEDVKTLQPWPPQTKAALENYTTFTSDDLKARGWHIPPFHPRCRTLCVPVGSVKETPPPMLHMEVPSQAVSQNTLKELGVNASDEMVTHWNAHVGVNPVEMIAELTGETPEAILAGRVQKPAIKFHDNGLISMKLRGINDHVKYAVGTVIDPYTGRYYLSQAEAVAGGADAQYIFMRRLLRGMITTGTSMETRILELETGSNAYEFAKMGFVPTPNQWDLQRKLAMEYLSTGRWSLQTLPAKYQELIERMLMDKNPDALTALVHLDLSLGGTAFGKTFLEQTSGPFALYLSDARRVAQALEYLKGGSAMKLLPMGFYPTKGKDFSKILNPTPDQHVITEAAYLYLVTNQGVQPDEAKKLLKR